MRRTTLLAVLIVTAASRATSATAAMPDSVSRASPPPAANSSSSDRARLLGRFGVESLSDSSIESRQRAIRDLKEAIRLEPGNAAHWLALGRAYELGRLGGQARECYARATHVAPRDPEGFTRLGQAWKREWLRTLDPEALEHAIGEFDTATVLRPHSSDAWLRLVPLLYERSDQARAAEAAARALAGRPRRPQVALAAAYLAYRGGEIERADSLFAATLPRLAPDVRALFLDPGPLLGGGSAQDGGAAGGAQDDGAARGAEDAPRSDATPAAPPSALTPDSSRRFWSRLDPDPTTGQNELQLEYWSRVAHVLLLFYDPLSPGLDARAGTYIRYGPPRGVRLNPEGIPLFFRYGHPVTSQSAPGMEYPVDVLVWDYADLGMRVVLQDRSLMGVFLPAATRDFDPTSVPNQRLLAQRDDLVSLGGGLAVFPTLPPREQRLDVRGVVARFEGGRGPRLLAQVQAPGQPGDTLWARWVVLDSTGREVSRAAQRLAPSACDPAARRVAEFSAELPVGGFDVAVSVRDQHRRRGLFRSAARLAPAGGALALSDVVLSCGDPSVLVQGPSVRLEANVDARVTGRAPLVVYFEIYHLAAGPDGTSRFAYEYAVRRTRAETRARKRGDLAPALLTEVSREESHLGTLRRQFVRVPSQSLPPGRYRLEVRVRDLVAGTAAEGMTEFTRE